MTTPSQRFFSSLEETTKPTYKVYLNKFFNYAKISHDEFCSYERKDQESLFENYIFYLRAITEKTGKYQNSYNTIFQPLKHFCIMNDIAINWDRLFKMLPKIQKLSGKKGYTDEDLKLYLEHCDNLRDLSFIHFMNSTAVRPGELYLLNVGDITPIEDGAIVDYYANQKDEYKVCLTPEAYDYLKKYLATRKNTRPEDPLFTSKKGIIERRLKKATLAELMKEIRNKVNPNQIKNGKRKEKSANNAFRKRLEDIFANIEMHHKYASYLLDHNKDKQDKHYLNDLSNERLWSKFKKAIPLITLDKSKQIIVEKNDEIEKLRESYEGEFKEKIEYLESKLDKMEKERSKKILEHYEDMEIKELDDEMITEISEANVILKEKPLEITPSHHMLRKKYLIRKQKNIISTLKKELIELESKIPKPKKEWGDNMSKDIEEDKEFSIWVDATEDYGDKEEEIYFAESRLTNLKNKF